MRAKALRRALSLCLTGAVLLSTMAVVPQTASAEAESGLVIEESDINQLLTGDLELPTTISGKDGAKITYSVEESKYVSVDGNTLKVTRPYAGEGNYSFDLKATVEYNGKTTTDTFPLTIAEGVSDDTYAGYVYACFGNTDGYDVQQLHLYLSEDGLNWTALNGAHPVFETGTDYIDSIEAVSKRNYKIVEGTDIKETTTGDASVLFPFEGDDQGIRDPYIIRGSRAEDSNKVWILATDLNTMSEQYGGSLEKDRVGNWGTMSTIGSPYLFVYETEDWVHWTRRYIDVGTEIGACMAWAPEAVYNPEKDNYLVYWSCRVNVDGRARDRLYCNETKDFVNFGPTKLYEEEPFWQNHNSTANNSGYGNIDTSQLWVADEDGNPYGTLYRVVKDETNNHIELMSAETVLDPDVNYDETEPIRITPYTFEGEEYATLEDLAGLTDRNEYNRAEIVYNWFINESTGNHFKYIEQKNMESKKGAYEGATMFKFNDRDEWCVMIDYYGNNSVRYEPYTTTDLSEPNSITKVTSGYGRTGGDVGCHGGMIPVTAEEYNTLIDTYNADSSVSNYHEIEYISCDKRALEDTVAKIEKKLEDTSLSAEDKDALEKKLNKADILLANPAATSESMEQLIDSVETIVNPVGITLSDTAVSLSVGASKKVTATVAPADAELTWKTVDETVATVSADGTIKAVGTGSTFVIVKSGKKAIKLIKVTVTAPVHTNH